MEAEDVLKTIKEAILSTYDGVDVTVTTYDEDKMQYKVSCVILEKSFHGMYHSFRVTVDDIKPRRIL